VLVGPFGLEVQVALDRPFEVRRERELQLALHREGAPEARDQLAERQRQGVEPELEGARLVELPVPVDAAVVVRGGEFGLPAVAVGVGHLVGRQRVAVLELAAGGGVRASSTRAPRNIAPVGGGRWPLRYQRRQSSGQSRNLV
jgi:hypothetical protein